MHKYLAPTLLAASLISCAPAASTNDTAHSTDRERSGHHQARRGDKPDLSATASQLGISKDALQSALNQAGGRPPNLAKAAEILGIEEQTLREAMPERPTRRGKR